MSRQLTIHLSAQARQAIRPGDGVSPRINQIIERYQRLLALAGPEASDRLLADAVRDLAEQEAATTATHSREPPDGQTAAEAAATG